VHFQTYFLYPDLECIVAYDLQLWSFSMFSIWTNYNFASFLLFVQNNHIVYLLRLSRLRTGMLIMARIIYLVARHNHSVTNLGHVVGRLNRPLARSGTTRIVVITVEEKTLVS
jgi:hypothetical protein